MFIYKNFPSSQMDKKKKDPPPSRRRKLKEKFKF